MWVIALINNILKQLRSLIPVVLLVISLLHLSEKTQVIQAVTFSSSYNGRSPTTFEFGSRFHHPKNVTKNCQDMFSLLVVPACSFYTLEN